MSEQAPPKFDSQNYARPNQGWICGHAAEGQPCPLGPDWRGRCQATAECAPSLETLPGESKGRWRCNRSGEKCESGPLPDGSCSRRTPKCAPAPTLRTLRGRVNRFTIAFTCAALLILLGIPHARQIFINSGPLSTSHSFNELGLGHGGTNQQSCSHCHFAGNAGPNGILMAALQAHPPPWQITKLLETKAGDPSRMDDACQKCHAGHAFHQPSVPREVGCSFCHREHQGSGRLPATTDAHCRLCHANATLMSAAAAKGARIAAKALPGAHPAGGFTEVIHSFALDHPEFRAVSSNLRDQDTLKFNHRLHLGTTIPALANGKKLDCAFCHQPDALGTLMRPIRFENHCQVCHSLQFDPDTPELRLPHGDAQFVSAFLHSLPQQYSDLARSKGITDAEQRKQFAAGKLAVLRAHLQPGEDFERRVFFSNALAGPAAKSGAVEGATRALYPGCAYCHEVKPSNSRVAEITKPVQLERWLTHGRFEHVKHSSISCAQCHPAHQSQDTADVLLPAKANCVACHSPRGGAPDSCVTCHTYHKPPGVHDSQQALRTSP
jgi:hypothetical protein